MTIFSFKSPSISQWAIDQYIADTHQEKKNQQVYCLYRINPLCFWRWKNYLVNAVHFEYMEWNTIEKNMQKNDINAQSEKYIF